LLSQHDGKTLTLCHFHPAQPAVFCYFPAALQLALAQTTAEDPDAEHVWHQVLKLYRDDANRLLADEIKEQV
jgi:hypothetical protein